jgi:hypothetical protein
MTYLANTITPVPAWWQSPRRWIDTHNCLMDQRGESPVDPGNRRSKRVKRGFKEARVPVVGGVIFESSPIWLWALRLCGILDR